MAHCIRVVAVVPDYSSGNATPFLQFPCQYAGKPTRSLRSITTMQMSVSIEHCENRVDEFVFEYLCSGTERDVYTGNVRGKRLVMKLELGCYNANAVEWDLAGGDGSSVLFCRLFSYAAVRIQGIECGVLLAEQLEPADVYLHRCLTRTYYDAKQGILIALHEFLKLMYIAKHTGYVLAGAMIEKLGWTGDRFVMLSMSRCLRGVAFEGAAWNRAVHDFLKSVWGMVNSGGFVVWLQPLVFGDTFRARASQSTGWLDAARDTAQLRPFVFGHMRSGGMQRLDRFGYATGYTVGSTLCWVKDDMYGLFLATVVYHFGPPGNSTIFKSLEDGEYSVWKSGWSIRVSGERCRGWRAYNSLHSLSCVPLKAFRGLKVIVRLLMLSRRCYVQQSPLRFCGGRELLRLSQSASVLRDVAVKIHPGSFHYIIGALSGGPAMSLCNRDTDGQGRHTPPTYCIQARDN